MKHVFLVFLLFFLLNSCKKESYKVATNYYGTRNVNYLENGNQIILKSGKFQYKIPHSKLPYKKIILLSASLVGYFTALNAEKNILGVSSPEYIYSEKIHHLISDKEIQNVGNEQKYDIEKIITLKPDVIFTNYISNFDNTYDLLKKNDIEIIFVDEFSEQNPLEKAYLINVFGKLLGKEKEASKLYSEIKKNYNLYKNLAQKSIKKPTVLANEMYGNQWFLPGGKTQLSQFIADANGKYINAENKDSKAIPMSFEEVFVKGNQAEFWVNLGNHQTKKELLQINPNYTKMQVFNQGKLYSLTQKEKGKSNDFFESGVVRADLVLKDYCIIFHPELFPNYKLIYMKELK